MEAKFLKAILDSMDDIIVFADNSHMVRFVNARAESIIKDGYAAIGRSIFSAYDDAYCETIRQAYERIEEHEKEIPLFESDGFKLYMQAVRNRKGALEGYLIKYCE